MSIPFIHNAVTLAAVGVKNAQRNLLTAPLALEEIRKFILLTEGF